MRAVRATLAIASSGDRPHKSVNPFTPDLYVQYFRDLRDMIASGHKMTNDAVADAMARYATVPSTDFAPDSSP